MMLKLVLASALVAVISAASTPLNSPLLPVLPSSTPTYRPQYAPVYNPQPGLVIPILRSESNIEPDGRYQYIYETGNGIFAEESGEPLGPDPEAPLAVRGSFRYTSPEGIPVEISYVADENGFHPSGNILSSSLSVPRTILRSAVDNVARPDTETRASPILNSLK